MTTLITTFITWLSLLTGAPGTDPAPDCVEIPQGEPQAICVPVEDSRPFFFDTTRVAEISNGF